MLRRLWDKLLRETERRGAVAICPRCGMWRSCASMGWVRIGASVKKWSLIHCSSCDRLVMGRIENRPELTAAGTQGILDEFAPVGESPG